MGRAKPLRESSPENAYEASGADGTWAAIYTRWLGGPAPAPPPAKYRD